MTRAMPQSRVAGWRSRLKVMVAFGKSANGSDDKDQTPKAAAKDQTPKAAWVANKKLEISNFNFKFPRARNIEMIVIRYNRQILQGSFSAVSKPNFASKY